MDPSSGNSDKIQGPTRPRPAATLAFWRDFLIVGAVTACGLYFGSGFLIPLSVALLLFVLLTSLIDRLATLKIGGRRIPLWLAHLGGLFVVLSGIAVIVSILSSQAQQVAEAVPRYEQRFTTVLTDITSAIGEKNAMALREAIAEIEITAFAVETLNTAQTLLSGLFLVILYLPFMMVERAPMKRKMTIASPDKELGTEISRAVHNISDGLQSYVGIKTLVSALTGVLSYAIMKFVGLDFAETWGVLAFALNFIPTLGSILAVILPSIVALVQFDTLTPFLIVAFGCGVVQFIIGNIVEPSMTGKKLNLSPMMVILALVFWSSIWGIAGAFLSVPITVCVMIVLAHVPGTRWAAILMSGDGRLRSESDQNENSEVVEDQPPEKSHRRSYPDAATLGASD